MNIMSNELKNVDQEDFTKYDYDPEFMRNLIYHLRAGGSNFTMVKIKEFFPEYSIFADFEQKIYYKFKQFVTLYDPSRKSKFIKYIVKYMDEIFTDLLLKPENQKIRENILEQEIGICSEKFKDFMECAEFIRVYVFHRRLYKSHNQVWFKNPDGRWVNNEPDIKQKIQSFILNNDFKILKNGSSEEPVYHRISRLAPAKELTEMVFLNIIERKNLLRDIWYITKGKLNFLNGTYDFKTNEFYEDPCGTLHMINRDLNSNSNPKLREEIMKRIFRPIFAIDDTKTGLENFKWFMYCVARMFAGDVEDKRILLVTGHRDCGKGILSRLIENCIDEYTFPMDLGSFKLGRNTSDEAKANSWIIPLQYRRVSIMNESQSSKLDGNKVKQFASGGDSICARSNHKDEIQIIIQCSGIIMANQEPDFNTNDVNEKIDQISLTSKFIDKDFPEHKKLKKVNYYPSDNTLKHSFLQRQDVLNEFFLMLIEAYNSNTAKPKDVLDQRNDDVDEYDLLREGFRISENNVISNKEMMEQVHRLGIKKKQGDIKKMLDNVFDGINLSFRTSSLRGVKGLMIQQIV